MHSDRHPRAGFDSGAGEADSFGTAVPKPYLLSRQLTRPRHQHRYPPPIFGVKTAPARTAQARTSLLCQPAVPSIAPDPYTLPSTNQPPPAIPKLVKISPFRSPAKPSNLLAFTPYPLDSVWYNVVGSVVGLPNQEQNGPAATRRIASPAPLSALSLHRHNAGTASELPRRPALRDRIREAPASSLTAAADAQQFGSCP